MSSKADHWVIEQHSSRNADGGGLDSRRLLMWAQMDLFSGMEVSALRRVGALLALSITCATVVLLLLSY